MKSIVVALAALLFCAAPGFAQDPGEISFWDSVKDSKNPAEIQAYIDGYPTGKFLPLARLRLNALKGAGGAPQPAPATTTATPAVAPAPAAPAAAATPSGKFGISKIGQIALIDAPQRVNDDALSNKLVGAAPNLKCIDMEMFAWQISDQQKLDAVVGTTIQALTVRGYNIQPSASSPGIVISAVSAVPLVDDPQLTALFSLQPGGLNLLLCRQEKK